MYDSKTNKDFTLPVTSHEHVPSVLKSQVSFKIPKGTYYQSFASFDISTDYNNIKMPYEGDKNYIRAFQDAISWFVDDKNGNTILILVMQADLGKDVPK